MDHVTSEAITGAAEVHDSTQRSLEQSSFFLEQYRTLREEIKDSKARLFRIMTVGAVIVPALNLLAKEHHDFAQVTIVAPLIVFVFGLWYISENRVIMRCGCYIRLRIETKLKDIYPKLGDFVAWETWLESEDDFSHKRLVDVIASIGFLILFAVYYLGSSFFAYRFIRETYSGKYAVASVIVYSLFAVFFLIILALHRGLAAKMTGSEYNFREAYATTKRKAATLLERFPLKWKRKPP